MCKADFIVFVLFNLDILKIVGVRCKEYFMFAARFIGKTKWFSEVKVFLCDHK